MNTYYSPFFRTTLALAALFTTTAAAQASVLIISNPGTVAPFSPEFSATYFEPYGTVSTATRDSVFVGDITAADSWEAGSSVLDYLNTFDLVVFGNGTGNGSTLYDSAGWASVQSGVLSISSYQVRNSRFGWAGVGSGADSTADVTVSIVDGSHEITSGFSSPIEFYAGTTEVQRLDDGAIGGDGNVLATLADGGIQLAVWDAGDTLFSGDIVSGRRAFFALNQNAWNDTALTADGGIALANTIGWTVIPEPSTYAAIFGAVVLGIVVLRRRNS